MNKERKKGLSTVHIILICGFICLIAAVGVAAYFIVKSQSNNDVSQVLPKGSLVIDESNLEDVKEELSEAVAEGMFEVNMNTAWNFPDGKSASTDAYVANGNANSSPISFEILIDGTENVYTSTVMPVGKQIKEIKLEKELSAGLYNAVCFYHLWKEDGTEKSSFGVNITINVLK